MLREDYIRLYTRQELPLAPAYESLYILNNHYNSDQQTTSVTEFYNSYGWVSKFKGKIKDDHLGIELLFLTILIEKYLVLDDDACSGEMRNEIRRFIDLHIVTWIPRWNDKMQEYSHTLCYKGIGTLILACIEDIYSFLGRDFSRSHPYESLKN